MTSHLQQLLDRVQEAGASLSVNGDKLRVATTAPMPTELVDELRQAKPQILNHLRGDTWDATDWWAFYEERCGVIEFDGSLPREEAERRAREECGLHWLHRHPPEPTDRNVCAGCGHPIGKPGSDGVPFLAGDRGHLWIHHGCWAGWMARRREEAEKALAELGVGAAT